MTLTCAQGANGEVTWGLLGGSVIEDYFENAEEEKFRHIAEEAYKHSEQDTQPSGSIYHMIKNRLEASTIIPVLIIIINQRARLHRVEVQA